MISDVSRQRIAIYWMEPALFREAPSFVRCCDLILDHDVVHYWIQGMSERGTFHLSQGEKDTLLAVQKSPESILRSALTTVSQIRCPSDETDTALEVAAFFERSRGHAQYKHAVSPNEVGRSQSLHSTASAIPSLNALPFEREYTKETRDDGSMVWRTQKAVNGPPVATVTVQRVHEFSEHVAGGTFDAETLGQWTLIHEAYRAYWSFDLACAQLRTSPDVRAASRELHDKIDAYLDNNRVPPGVGRALERLRFQAALMTADSSCVWQSAQAVVTGLCQDDTLPKHQCLIDLGSMSGRIQREYPERMEERLRPLVAHVVHHAAEEAATGTGIDRLMTDIMRNGWFTYGELLLAEVHGAGLIGERDVDSWRARLQASRLARGGAAPDSGDATPSVQRYLSQLDADPPKGTVDMNDVHRILNEGLAKRYAQDQSEAKRKVVEDTIRAIRLIAGEGPFCGDPDRLIASIDRFSRHCLVVNRSTKPFDTVLATFLVLSFCDTSTTEDHELLFCQLQHCSAELQGQVNAMLADRGLAALVTPEDVGRTFQVYERIFRRYVDDPLGPAFKFPWTRNEEARLGARLRLRLMQLEALLDEIVLKVEYGGASAELRDRTVCEISEAAQGLLSQAAFLRVPPCPGVACRYLGGYGFSVVIQGPLYQEGHRPRERFRAMKYFHLGRRLQSVVEQERELTLRAEKGEMSK